MAALLVRSVLASVAGPLLRLRRLAEEPRPFSLLLGAPRGAGPPWGLPLPPARTFKTKGTVKKRCRDCYLVKRRGRWFVLCKTNPKHKQRHL